MLTPNEPIYIVEVYVQDQSEPWGALADGIPEWLYLNAPSEFRPPVPGLPGVYTGEFGDGELTLEALPLGFEPGVYTHTIEVEYRNLGIASRKFSSPSAQTFLTVELVISE